MSSTGVRAYKAFEAITKLCSDNSNTVGMSAQPNVRSTLDKLSKHMTEDIVQPSITDLFGITIIMDR